MKPCQPRIQGFTLIELLISVAIIGILVTISSANYLDAIYRADVAACQQNLRTIHTAIMAYRADNNHFPPGDGTAGYEATPNQTEWGCGPAANGYWSGVSLLLTKNGYCQENSLYCPLLQRKHSQSIPAYPTCSNTTISKKNVPQWYYLRYAYNSAALDAGGFTGGENDIDTVWKKEVWLVRCLHLNVSEFDPERNVPFPLHIEPDEDHPERNWYGEFELTVLGEIKQRRVERQ